MTISVIMSTYRMEKAEYLDAAMRSIWTGQKRKPDEIVLVEDGVLTPELYAVIDRWKECIGNDLVIVRRENSEGLAAALNDAIAASKGDLLARMDSDDISVSERFAIQEKYMEEHHDVDILGGALREFNDAGTLNKLRIYPATMDDVRQSMHRMSPLGHPTVMFRRRFFDQGFRYSGKYKMCEDVTLWFEAVHNNRVINNIPDVLIKFRRNDSVMKRRSRRKAWSEFKAYNDGINMIWGRCTTRYLFSFMRLAFRLMPITIIKFMYRMSDLRNGLS